MSDLIRKEALYPQVRSPENPIELDSVASPPHRSGSIGINFDHGYGATKRKIDVVLSAIALVFFFPLMALLAVLIKLTSPGPAVFSQSRIGFGGRQFKCYKFRTMVNDADEQLAKLLATCPAAQQEWKKDQKLRNDPRITKIGIWLRKLSLDELPQLFNILKGDMSIVGPRPIIEDECQKYGTYFLHYCSVKPGLTGLWQVSGRNNLSYDKRVELDATYAREQSLALDCKIIWMTLPAVLLSRGSY
ncbi:MAG: sugar transferase [Pseudomonadota bacterium]